jgi:hypothetical protein
LASLVAIGNEAEEMETQAQREAEAPEALAVPLVGAVLKVSWTCIRFPLLALLSLLAPIVSVVLTGFALLVTLTALFFKLAGPPGLSIPFWGMLGTAVLCMALLALYQGALRLLSS